MKDTVAVAAVTFDRPDDVKILLESLSSQSHAPHGIALVDAGTADVRHIAEAQPGTVNYIRSLANLGGAGGFSLAILSAIASGAEWVWIMDDDAHPEDSECLEKLLAAAHERSLDVVLPIVVAPGEPDKLSFPFRPEGRVTHDRAEIEKQDFMPNIGHFFNGALIRTSVFFKVGLPDMKLFIRGDEVDFMLRLRKAGVPFGTITSVALTHPAGWGEVQTMLGERLHVLVPETAFKRYFFFRNRGVITRRYRRPKSLVADLVGYPVHYIRTRDFKGLRFWASTYCSGLRNKGFGTPKDLGL